MDKYEKIPESDVITKYVKRRFGKGLGTNIFVIGLPGTGKSSTSLRYGELIAEELHGDYEITARNVADSLLEVLDFVMQIKRKGEILIIEEASVLFPSTRAMSSENLSIAKIFDTIRKKQVILISNAPLIKRIDGHMRSLGHVLVETLRIDRTNEVVISKPLRMQTNPGSGKTYFHRFQRDGREVHRTFTRKPNVKVWEDYERKKDLFMKDLYYQLKKKQEMKIKKELKGIVKVPEEDLPMNQKKLLSCWKKGITKNNDVARETGMDVSNISKVKKAIEKKGYLKKDYITPQK
jgi:hypothetical protein